jgi:Flp pilus assembly pilin Flp
VGDALLVAGLVARERAGAAVAWLHRGQRGFATLEYALVVAVMAIGCLVVMTALRDQVRAVFQNITAQLQPFTTGAGGTGVTGGAGGAGG